MEHIYRKLFLITLQLSACTFGGGFVIIALMKKKFVEQYKWIEEEEMLDLTAIAQSTPGAIAVNASILVGYRVAGFRGAMMTVLGTCLPPLIIVSIISLFYVQFRDSAVVNMIMASLLAAVAAVICDVVISMAGGILRQKQVLPVIIMLAAFGAVHFADVNIILIIFICVIIGAAGTIWRKHREKGEQI